MEQPKHTPAPWGWEHHPDLGTPIALVSKETDVLLVTGDGSRAWAVISEADQALIAAAPDLLEAAMSVVNWHDALDGNMDNKFGDDAIEKLRDAIAKATGQEVPS